MRSRWVILGTALGAVLLVMVLSLGWPPLGREVAVPPASESQAPVATAVSAPRAIDAPLVATSCDEPVAIPPISQPTSAAWSPDGKMLALGVDLNGFQRMRRTPLDLDKRRIQLLHLDTLAVEDLARGARPRWSPSGRYLAFEEPTDGRLQVPVATVIWEMASRMEVGRVPSSIYDWPIAWRGDELLYWTGQELRGWTPGADRLLLTVDGLRPWDWIQMSGDAERFSIQHDEIQRGNAPIDRLDVGDTRRGVIETLSGVWSALWSPAGHRLLIGYLDRREMRDEDGTRHVVDRPLRSWLSWWRDGRTPLLYPYRPIEGARPTFAEFTAFEGARTGVVLPLESFLPVFDPTGSLIAAIYRNGPGMTDLRLYRCVAPAAAPAPPPDQVTLYYTESIEPWAADRVTGVAPAGWLERARADLERVGLRPIAIERLEVLSLERWRAPTATPPKVTADWRPARFALAVTLPFAQIELAGARCLQFGSPPSWLPIEPSANLLYERCEPLYPLR